MERSRTSLVKLILKNLLFTLLVPGTVSVYVPLLITRGRDISTNPTLLVIGILLLVIGTAIYLWTVWDFASFGRGTPLPLDAPKKLVVRGLYRCTRNPMYVGVILVILGWAGLFRDGWLLVYSLGVGIVIHLFVVLYEESRLTELFGVDYENYRRSVGRWVFGLPSKKGDKNRMDHIN
jgi:protein-S-isoprenylcysteine O-methyltransferase Ste14